MTPEEIENLDEFQKRKIGAPMKPDKMNDVLPSGHVKIFKYKQATTWLNKITASKEEIEEHDRLILSLEDRINHFKPLIKKIVTDSALYKMANY